MAAAARALTEDFAGLEQPADLHRNFALAYSLSILHELIGVPAEERERAAQLLADIGRGGTDGAAAPGPGPLFALFGALAETERAAPQDDVLSRLVTAGPHGPGRRARRDAADGGTGSPPSTRPSTTARKILMQGQGPGRRDQGLSFGSGRISERGLVRAIARRRKEPTRSVGD
ncbi:hypothetical protein OG905_35485 [Streptomyces sp. NBC_00322]|uniref:hypothetical protein n=1 Tax=Streptomyces sp. NBC_00322 TaxID=2975712 RepID=UPI002E28ECEC|nr:hypothetical protein [Streptomyces sp. NBC_00322]